jgi:hypothetical protein
LPVPLAAPHDAPAPARQVQVTPVSEAGTASVMVALVTVEGPALLTTMVYVTGEPGTASAAPSVLVMLNSAVARTLSISVAELLAVDGSVVPDGAATVAVLVKVPVPEGVVGFKVPVTV